MSKYSKKTKSNFDDILDGLEDDDDFEEIIPGRRKKESRWAKVGKIIVGTALVGALGALGFYGLKQYDEVKYENLMNTLKEYGVKTKDLLKIGKAAEADNNEKAPDIQESLNTTPMESKKPDSKSDTVENPFNKGEMVPKLNLQMTIKHYLRKLKILHLKSLLRKILN